MKPKTKKLRVKRDWAIANGYKRQALLDEKGLYELVHLASETKRIIKVLTRIAELIGRKVDYKTIKQEARISAKRLVQKKLQRAIKEGRFK